jgi:hypothetical protein
MRHYWPSQRVVKCSVMRQATTKQLLLLHVHKGKELKDKGLFQRISERRHVNSNNLVVTLNNFNCNIKLLLYKLDKEAK